jgi:hypothetical protein
MMRIEMLEKKLKLIKAIKEDKGKRVVIQRFDEYFNAYENLEREPSVKEKIEHRDLMLDYMKYVSRSGFKCLGI